MLTAALSGFFISLSLILAIGPQNSFVIRQGLVNQHVGLAVLFCGLSDALLICLGVLGLGTLMAPFFTAYSDWLFGLSALWLAFYGAGRLYAALTGAYDAQLNNEGHRPEAPVRGILVTLFVLTFANPHVYLDTVILLGAVSIRYAVAQKLAFAAGAASASFLFFAAIGFGAQRLSPFMTSRRSWQVLDALTALIMFIFAGTLLAQTSFLNGV